MADARTVPQIQVDVATSMLRDQDGPSGTSRDGQLAAIATLQKLLGNVQGSPAENKFRTIKLTNPKIAARICACSGAVKMLTACGYKEQARVLTLEGGPDLALLARAQEQMAGLVAEVKQQESDEKQILLASGAAGLKLAQQALRRDTDAQNAKQGGS